MGKRLRIQPLHPETDVTPLSPLQARVDTPVTITAVSTVQPVVCGTTNLMPPANDTRARGQTAKKKKEGVEGGYTPAFTFGNGHSRGYPSDGDALDTDTLTVLTNAVLFLMYAMALQIRALY